MDLWDRDAIDLVGPAILTVNRDGTGHASFIAVEGALDCRFRTDPTEDLSAEFTWEGSDDGEPVSGRGWLRLDPDGTLAGHIYFHLGDDSGFRARAHR